MVIAAVVKSVGVKNPIQFIRRVKSTYVETKEQESFVASIPAVIDSKISIKYPELAAVIALGTLQQAQQQSMGGYQNPIMDTVAQQTQNLLKDPNMGKNFQQEKNLALERCRPSTIV
jgi:hypothetical protein